MHLLKQAAGGQQVIRLLERQCRFENLYRMHLENGGTGILAVGSKWKNLLPPPFLARERQKGNGHMGYCSATKLNVYGK